MKKLATLLLLICAVSAQTKLTPTEIETLKLAKLKAQLATLGQSVETVKVQIQLYQAQQ
jgi:conjugal transfer/entry exclusion protein